MPKDKFSKDLQKSRSVNGFRDWDIWFVLSEIYKWNYAALLRWRTGQLTQQEKDLILRIPYEFKDHPEVLKSRIKRLKEMARTYQKGVENLQGYNERLRKEFYNSFGGKINTIISRISWIFFRIKFNLRYFKYKNKIKQKVQKWLGQ